jgi:hypothetical protein
VPSCPAFGCRPTGGCCFLLAKNNIFMPHASSSALRARHPTQIMTRTGLLKRLTAVVATTAASASAAPPAATHAASAISASSRQAIANRFSRRWYAAGGSGVEIKDALAAAIPAQQVRLQRIFTSALFVVVGVPVTRELLSRGILLNFWQLLFSPKSFVPNDDYHNRGGCCFSAASALSSLAPSPPPRAVTTQCV